MPLDIPSKKAKCAACGKFLSPIGAATCSICPSFYHRACVSIADTASLSKDWSCPECKSKTRRGNNSSTPVRGVCGSYSQDIAPNGAVLAPVPTKASLPAPAIAPVLVPPTAQAPAPSRVTASTQALAPAQSAAPAQGSAPAQAPVIAMSAAPTASLVDVALDAASAARGVDLLRRELADYAAEMRDFRREMADQRIIVAGVNARLDGLERRLEEMERRVEEPAASFTPAVTELERTVELLRRELEDRDQDALLSDLEIGHLPEERGESVGHAVILLAAKLGVKLDERDIVYAERVGRNSSGEAAASPRARRIVVRLSRRPLRDELLAAARVRRTLTAVDAGGASQAVPPGRIFVNERLTRNNRQLFYRVREECRRLNWRYSWTKRGRIYVRRCDGEPAHPIRSEDDFGRVFRSSPV